MHQLPESTVLPVWSGSKKARSHLSSRPQNLNIFYLSCMHPCWSSSSMPGTT